MHAAMVDETGVAPRNQQRSGRGGHAGAAAGNPESSDEGIRVAPRKTAPHCLGSRLLMLRGAARQGVAAAGIRLRTLFCRSVELGIGLVARPRSTHKKPRVETREHAAREPAASCRGSLGGPPPAWNQPGPPGLARTQEAPGGNPGTPGPKTNPPSMPDDGIKFSELRREMCELPPGGFRLQPACESRAAWAAVAASAGVPVSPRRGAAGPMISTTSVSSSISRVSRAPARLSSFSR